MTIHTNIENDNANFHPGDENHPAIDKKLDELIALIHNSDIDTEKSTQLKTVFNQALKEAAYKSDNEHGSDEFSILLSNAKNKDGVIKKYLLGESMSKFVLIGLSVVMIILGLGMIIMPAPPFFEMFTIFYFNRDDGITIMDLISLIIILSGVYFLIKGIYKNPGLKKLTKNNHSTKTKNF